MRLCNLISPISFLLLLSTAWTEAADLGDIANSLKAGYIVVRNGIPLHMGPTPITAYLANITLENIGTKPISPVGWSLNLCHDKLIHPTFFDMSTMQFNGGGLVLPGNFTLAHSVGCMYKFEPLKTVNFTAKDIQPGEKIIIPIVANEFFVSKYSAFPNWYLANGTHTNLIPNTMNNNMDFVGNFDKDKDIQYTRFINDFASIIYSPMDRYRGLKFASKDATQNDVLPTPFRKVEAQGKLTLDSSWFIDFDAKAMIKPMATYLQRSIKQDTGLSLGMNNFGDGTPKVIQILLSTPTSGNINLEAYTLQVNAKLQRIIINGFSREGVINGIHSLRSLLADDNTIEHLKIDDYPRFSYRGVELDLASNFFGPLTIKKVMDVMAFYKLNKLVLILGEENGWRIDMSPEIPELTQIGGRRCHDPSETNCLFSQLGSKPDGTEGGYLTAMDYEDLLKYAHERNIEIIPHINMAGKARAAIKSMIVHAAATGDRSKLLRDANDHFKYLTDDLFSDSAVNPCLPQNSTANFFEFVLTKMKKYHSNAKVPLKTVHIGNSPPPAFLNSSACDALTNLTMEDLYLEVKVNYSMALANIADKLDVKLIGLDETFIAWPTVLHARRIVPWMTPFSRTRFPAKSKTFDVISISKTFDQLPQGHRAQLMANSNYTVILQPEDYFRLDYAPEPNPTMPGDYNAQRRFINATRTFNFLPDQLCCNFRMADEGAFGCTDQNNCLESRNSSNVIGVQASMSTRHIKDEETLFRLMVPRIIAYAERAWHKASWEDSYKVHQILNNRVNMIRPDLAARDTDWTRVASIIGNKEFHRLVNILNVKPNILPPGARKIKDAANNRDILRVDTSYPGLVPQVKTSGSAKYVDIAAVTDVTDLKDKEFLMRTRFVARPNSKTLVLNSPEDTMLLKYQSLREEIIQNITLFRRESELRREQAMRQFQQMEMMRLQEMRQQQQRMMMGGGMPGGMGGGMPGGMPGMVPGVQGIPNRFAQAGIPGASQPNLATGTAPQLPGSAPQLPQAGTQTQQFGQLPQAGTQTQQFGQLPQAGTPTQQFQAPVFPTGK